MIHSAAPASSLSFRRRGLRATVDQEIGAAGRAVSPIPVIGPIIAGVASLIQAFNIGEGCGGTCKAATAIVNAIEPLLKQNLAAARQTVAQNGCLTPAEQAQCLANFTQLWQEVVAGCSQIPAPGGTQCLADREPGGKTDWFSYYQTPIQQMPVCAAAPATNTVAPIATVAAATLSDVITDVPTEVWLIAAAIGAVLLIR